MWQVVTFVFLGFRDGLLLAKDYRAIQWEMKEHKLQSKGTSEKTVGDGGWCQA